MNVNPFSYLIEKLKSKVDKSGDTMSGDLTLGKASTVLKIRGADKYTNLTSNVTSSDKNIALPDASGTIALTSDISNKIECVTAAADDGVPVSFDISNAKLSLIICGHPYNGDYGEYIVVSGYTTGSYASVGSLHASAAITDITKTNPNTVQVTVSRPLDVQVWGVGVKAV